MRRSGITPGVHIGLMFERRCHAGGLPVHEVTAMNDHSAQVDWHSHQGGLLRVALTPVSLRFNAGSRVRCISSLSNLVIFGSSSWKPLDARDGLSEPLIPRQSPRARPDTR